MNPNQPATPANAAIPGAQEQKPNETPAPNPAPPSGAGGENQEPKVTLTQKEYRDLLRQDARAKAFDRRYGGKAPRPNAPADNGATPDDEVLKERDLRISAEQRALQSEVKFEVKSLLDKPEYSGIPQSTKDLILRNPGSVTNAETREDAIYDIEDWLNEQKVNHPPTSKIETPPVKHEVPPVVNPGAPAPAGADQLEDISKLHGPAKTQAMIRNAIKNKRNAQ